MSLKTTSRSLDTPHVTYHKGHCHSVRTTSRRPWQVLVILVEYPTSSTAQGAHALHSPHERAVQTAERHALRRARPRGETARPPDYFRCQKSRIPIEHHDRNESSHQQLSRSHIPTIIAISITASIQRRANSQRMLIFLSIHR